MIPYIVPSVSAVFSWRICLTPITVVIMRDFTANSLSWMTHRVAHPIYCILRDQTFKPGNFAAGLFLRKPITGKNEGEYPVPFYQEIRILFSAFRQTYTPVRSVGEIAGLCKFTNGLCDC